MTNFHKSCQQYGENGRRTILYVSLAGMTGNASLLESVAVGHVCMHILLEMRTWAMDGKGRLESDMGGTAQIREQVVNREIRVREIQEIKEGVLRVV